MQAQKSSKQQIKYRNDRFDLSKAKTKAENLYEMAAEKGQKEREKIGVYVGLKGGLFLEPCPK